MEQSAIYFCFIMQDMYVGRTPLRLTNLQAKANPESGLPLAKD